MGLFRVHLSQGGRQWVGDASRADKHGIYLCVIRILTLLNRWRAYPNRQKTRLTLIQDPG